MRWTVVACLVIVCSALLAAQTASGPAASQPATAPDGRLVYASDFTQGPGPQWSSRRVEMLPAAKTPVLGRFTNDAVTLSLRDLPPHQFVRVSVDCCILLDWWAHAKPPIWSLWIGDGPLLMRTSFAKLRDESVTALGTLVDEPNPKPSATDTLGMTLEGPGKGADNIYSLTFVFQHDGPDLALLFAAEGIDNASTAAWALRNVRVETLEAAKLTLRQMEALWAKMALPDAADAREAQDALAAAGDDAADFIKSKFSSAAIDGDKLAKLVAQLDAEDFQDRQDASKALARMGPAVAGGLRDALKKTESEEVRTRITALLEQLTAAANADAVGNPTARAIKMLASLRSAKAIEALAAIEEGLSDTRTTAAARAAMMQVTAMMAPPAQRPHREMLELGAGLAPMQLVLPPAGKFLMGATDADRDHPRDDMPQHEVTLAQPFYIGATLVTVAQYQAVTGPAGATVATDPPAGAARVTWAEADAFCRKLSQRTGLDVRLPTEAQWEYACRAGTKGKWCFGDNGDLAEHFTSGVLAPAATLPNGWGLFDMHVADQWCADWYAANYYAASPAADPQGPASGALHVRRGGPSSKRTAGDGPGCFRVVVQSAALRYCKPAYLANFKIDGETATTLVTVAMNNATSQPSQQQAAWILPPGSKWRVTPQRIEANLAPGASQEAAFAVAFDGAPIEASPLPELAVSVAGKDAKIQPPISLDLRGLFKACPPRAKAPRANPALKLTGDLKDPAWAAAAVLSKFMDPNGDPNIAQPTEVRVLYDDKALYLGIRCTEAKERLAQLAAMQTQPPQAHDSPIYNFDCVEIFVDPNAGVKTYYQFISNPQASQFDSEKWDSAWNGVWQSKTGSDDKSWTLEIALPWETLGVKNPKPGYKLGLNLVRSRMAGNPSDRTMWSPVFSNTNHVATRLGQITLGE